MGLRFLPHLWLIIFPNLDDLILLVEVRGEKLLQKPGHSLENDVSHQHNTFPDRRVLP